MPLVLLKVTARQVELARHNSKHSLPLMPGSPMTSPPEMCMPGYACQPDGSAANKSMLVEKNMISESTAIEMC